MTAAVSAMEAAYTTAAARPTTDSSMNRTSAVKPDWPGVYTLPKRESIQILPLREVLTTCSSCRRRGPYSAANKKVILQAAHRRKTYFGRWGYVEIGACRCVNAGQSLVKTKVIFITGSSSGSVLAQTGR
jgi:hypothetical protein